MNRRQFLGAAAAAGLCRAANEPLFSFGVLADLQYADKESANRREYRSSIRKLEDAAGWFSRERLEFVIQLGDLVDGGMDNVDRMLRVWNRLTPPKRHVIGNHDGEIDRAALLKRLGMRRAYYDFSIRGWRFVVLDGMDWSVSPGWPEASENRRQGARMLAGLRGRKEPNAQAWNGGIGDAQNSWLRQTLRNATARKERVIVFCHFPVVPESCRPEHLLWNWRAILEVLESDRSVVAWMNGHDHRGGYAARAGIHYVTIPGVVEHDMRDSARIVDVLPGRLVIRSPKGVQLLELHERNGLNPSRRRP